MEVKNENTTLKTIPNDVDKEQKGINVPNLRFGEFRGKYNKHKLNECCKLITKGTTPHEFTDTGINFVKIDAINGVVLDSKKFSYISQQTHIGELKRSILKEDDVLLAIAGATVGKHCIVKKTDLPANTNQALAIIRTNNKLLPEYLLNVFDTCLIPEFIKKICASSAQPNLNLQQIANLNLNIPSVQEQNRINKFLNAINQRILTQSKIIEDLEALKKGIWDNFYKKESLNWNEVKLKNVLTERKTYCIKDSTYPHATLSKDGISLKTDRYNRDFLVKDDEKNYKVTHLNDICYNPANLKFGVICRNKLGSAIFSPIYITYEVNSNFNPAFIEYILTNSSFINYIRKYEQGTVYERMAVNSEDFLKGIIKLPPLDIQTKIINLMHSFEFKIQTEKDMLELYKKQKAYLLQNMFI